MSVDAEFVPDTFPELVHAGSGTLTRQGSCAWTGEVIVSGASGSYTTYWSLSPNTDDETASLVVTIPSQSLTWFDAEVGIDCELIDISGSEQAVISGFSGQANFTISEAP